MHPSSHHGRGDRDDAGFSFVQMLVTMVIAGILITGVGLTVFQYIGTARNTVLKSNITTAAASVQNALALNPGLRSPPSTVANLAAGEVPADLLNELRATAAFEWKPVEGQDTNGWTLKDNDTPEQMHVQMIPKGAAVADAKAAVTLTTLGLAPKVRWLVADYDAVRLQARNADGSWACALVVLRPDWNQTMAGSTTGVDASIQAAVEGNLRGTWYDAGADIPTDGGLHHCSPTIGTGVLPAAAKGNLDAKDGAAAVKDLLPVDASDWTIPADGTTVVARTFGRTLPDFD